MKRKIILFVFGLILFVVFLAGCYTVKNETIKGNGNVIDQERQVERFDRIVLSGVGNMNVYPAENYRVVVTTDSNIQDYVVVKTSNNILTLTLKPGINIDQPTESTQFKFDVYLPVLKSVNMEGVGKIIISAGNTSDLEIYFSGVGSIDSQNYQVQNVTITHSGVGNATIWATNSINVNFSGIGDIRYKGNPKINVNRWSGIGDIRFL